MEIEELKRKLDVAKVEMAGSQRTIAALQAQIQADKTTMAKMTIAIDDLDLAGREQLAAFNRSIAEIQSLKSQVADSAAIKSQVALLKEQLAMSRASLRDAEIAQSTLAANVREGKLDCPVDFTGTGRAGSLTRYIVQRQLFLSYLYPCFQHIYPCLGKVSSERRPASGGKGGGRLITEVVPGELPAVAAMRMGYEQRIAGLEARNRQTQTMDLEVARALKELAELQAAYAATSAQLQQARKDAERVDGENALLEANYLLKLKLLVQEFEEYKGKTSQMIAELKSVVLTKDITIAQLNGSFEGERKSLKDALEELGVARGQLVALEERMKTLQAVAEKAVADQADNKRAAELQAVREQHAAQLSALIADNETRKIALHETSAKLLDARKTIEALTAEALTKDTTIAQLTVSLERERLATKGAHEELGLSRRQMVELEQRLVALQIEKAAQSAAAGRLDEAFANLQSENQSVQRASEETAVSLLQAKQDVERIRKEKDLLEALIVEFVDYKNETTQTIAELKAKNQQLASVQNEVAKLKEEAAEREKHTARLLAEITRLKSEGECREERIRNEILRADDALEKVAFWSHEATEIAAAFEKELAEKTKAFETKTKELEGELATARALAEEIGGLTRQKSIDQQQIVDLRGEVARLSSKMNGLGVSLNLETKRADDALEKVAFWSKEATEIAAAFEKELAEKTEAFETKTKELEGELTAARGHTLSSLTSLEEASGNVDQLANEVAMLKQDLLTSQAMVASITADLKNELFIAAALRKDLDDLNLRSQEDAQSIKKAEDAVAELSRCRDTLLAEKEKTLSDVTLIRNDLKVP